MFNTITLLGTPPKEIALATRLGSTIANERGGTVCDYAREKHARILRDVGRLWIARIADCVSGYNCAGHVWGARRTVIGDEPEWRKILDEDGYQMLRDREMPKLGDLAIYRLPNDLIVHVGEVVRVESNLGLWNTFILSKWDDTSGEFLHQSRDVPFRRQLPDFRLEYWTERLRAPL